MVQFLYSSCWRITVSKAVNFRHNFLFTHTVGAIPDPRLGWKAIFSGCPSTPYHPQFFQIIYLIQEYLIPVDIIGKEDKVLQTDSKMNK
jgi:hypothetical protein